MADKSDIVWGMYQENTTQGRHHESQRETVTNLIITITGVLLALVALDDKLNQADLPLAIFVTLLGLWGAVFSLKHYERYLLHMSRARQYRNALDALLSDAGIKKLKQDADTEHNNKWPWLHQVRLFWFWLSIHIVVAAIGLIITIMALGHTA